MRIRLLVSMTVVSLLCACSFDTDDTSPQVTDTVPESGAGDVPADTEITVTFNEPLLSETLHGESLVVTADGEPVSGTLSYDDVSMSLIFTPDTLLTKTLEYDVTLDPDMTDFARNRLGAYSFSFTVADGEWGEAFALSDGTSDASNPVIATAPDGTAIAAWGQSDGAYNTIYAAHYSPDFGWGFPGAIDIYALGDAGTSPQISTGANGDTFVIWNEDDDGTANGGDGTGNYSIWATRYTVEGGWEAPLEVEPFGTLDNHASQPQIAVDGEGNAIAVWAQLDDSVSPSRWDVWYNIFSVNSLAWQGPDRLETDNTGDATSPRIAINANGQAIAGWNLDDTVGAGGIPSAYVNRYSPGDGWQGAEEIDSDPGNTTSGSGPLIAINAGGEMMVAWTQVDDPAAPTVAEYAGRFFVEGQWSEPVLISDGDTLAIGSGLALDDRGVVTATWGTFEAGFSFINLYAARYTPDDGWTGPMAIETDPERTSFSSSLAIDMFGNALLVWSLVDGELTDIASGADVSVQASRYRESEGAWSTAEFIETLDTAAGSTKVAIGPDADGIAVWSQGESGVSNIRVNHFQ